jgi:anti-sigma regulatory factor (Ser/Thr protein kinase)
MGANSTSTMRVSLANGDARSGRLANIGPVPVLPEEVWLDLPFEADGLYALRASLAVHAARLGASADETERLVMVASELATNAIRHGGGRGRLRLWSSDGFLYCEIDDDGDGLADLDMGRTRPGPTAAGGRGIWMSRQLSDEFAIVAGPTGTKVRIAIALIGEPS